MDIQRRMANIETEFAEKVGSALDLIKTVDRRQQAMAEKLQAIQEQVETQGQQSQAQERTIKEIVQRLERLENERADGPGMWPI